jgi:hypothetical protein
MIREVGEGADLHDAVTLVNADGSGERELTEGSYFDWSPDGSQLVVSDAGGPLILSSDWPPARTYAIHVINADGSDGRWLADGEYPAWAPGGAD